MTTTFRDLGIEDALCQALDTQGITEPFPIQSLTIPLALEGADVIGQARTGTGKTLAFGLPLLQRIHHGTTGVHALVVTPTRELASQVAEDLERAGQEVDARVVTVYGGVSLDPQQDAMKEDRADIVVGTPGRLLDHVRRGNLDLSGVRVLVLDEADRMLDMGFIPDIEAIVERCPDDRQTLLFSATMPPAIVALARRYMDRPTFIRAEEEAPQVAPETEQHFFLVHRMDKPRVLARILQDPSAELATVFVRTKRMADRLVDELRQWHVNATPIHGDLRQSSRERNLDRFRQGKIEVLVATEVAARGLDIDRVTHVVNYDCPDDEHMYLHRIGRTGRAGAAGVAVTFAEANEVERVNMIRRAIGIQEPMLEVFSTSPELREIFDLPEATPWDHLSRSAATDDTATSQRSRQRGRSGSPSEPKGTKTTEKPTRKKTPDTSSAAPAAEVPGSNGDSSDDDAPARVRVRRREEPTPPERDGDGGEKRRRERRPRRGSDSGGGEAASNGEPDSTEQRSGGGQRKGSRGRSRGGTSTRSGSRSSHASTPDRPSERGPEPSETPRGEGVPRLARPVEVRHLP